MHKPLPSFERLLDMAKNNPDALERLRQKHVKAAINNAPAEYRHRLSGLQFRIDGQRHLAKNPMSACIGISQMMHESLHQLKNTINGEARPDRNEMQAATILPFPQRAL